MVAANFVVSAAEQWRYLSIAQDFHQPWRQIRVESILVHKRAMAPPAQRVKHSPGFPLALEADKGRINIGVQESHGSTSMKSLSTDIIGINT